MRQVLLIILFISIGINAALSQSNKNSKQIQRQINQRVKFYSVNNHYKIIPDTIYYTNSGFMVNYGYDTIKTNGITYYVFSYPNWLTVKKQPILKKNHKIFMPKNKRRFQIRYSSI